jgi:hypothetical protein
MEIKALEPITKLTVDDVKKLAIHSTYSGLRRACAVKPSQMVPASEEVPTLWYVLDYDPMDPDNLERQEWRAHALSAEISRFLLMKSVEGEESGSDDIQIEG